MISTDTAWPGETTKWNMSSRGRSSAAARIVPRVSGSESVNGANVTVAEALGSRLTPLRLDFATSDLQRHLEVPYRVVTGIGEPRRRGDPLEPGEELLLERDRRDGDVGARRIGERHRHQGRCRLGTGLPPTRPSPFSGSR